MRLMTQQLIKDSNMKLLYASIYNQPGISRTLLSKKTRLSKTTVSTLVDELIERRFIMDSGASPILILWEGNPIFCMQDPAAIM